MVEVLNLSGGKHKDQLHLLKQGKEQELQRLLTWDLEPMMDISNQWELELEDTLQWDPNMNLSQIEILDQESTILKQV